MSTDSSLDSQGDTMSTSCASNLAASLQQASLSRSISADDAPVTKLGSLQVASSPFCFGLRLCLPSVITLVTLLNMLQVSEQDASGQVQISSDASIV